MKTQFYDKLTEYLKTHDIVNANRVIMSELGHVLVKDRENFVTLLRYADVPANEHETDAQLIETFVDNIGSNRKLMVGASFLINQHNKQVGFDGEEEISDAGVKAVHKCMFNYFNGPCYSNANGTAIGAVAGAVGELSKVGGQALQGRQKQKTGVMDSLQKKQDAKDAMVQSVLDQRRAQQEAAQKKAADKAKNKKILIIATASVLGIALIAGGIYWYKHRNK